MYIGIALLCLSYIFSQFFRSFLAVLSSQLSLDIGATADQLALASGLWFLSFSAMQIPIGWSLDKFGPRLTAGLLFMVGGGGGAALFAAAQAVWHVHLAMLLLGVGCAPVLMGAYFIFARLYPAKVFATLAAVMVGVGSVGNLAGSAPLVSAVQVLGWREAMALIAALSAAIGVGLLLFVRNPEPLTGKAQGSLLDLLRLRALWVILPLALVSYAPAAGLRGVWIGPYLTAVHGADAAAVGRAAMIMSLAMIMGTFVYGPLDRIFKTRKWVVLGGNALGALSLGVLGFVPQIGYTSAVTIFALVGFFGMSYPVLVAHGRSFAPAHLTGRGVTLMNLFSIAGVGVFQVITSRLHKSVVAESGAGTEVYNPLFMLYALALFTGVLIYGLSQDRLD
ncbi:MAG: MFS transporter [Marinovum sp.]|nr:MFS transporter [Marinovum sp.]